MKNLKKISLISFLACATLAGGILAANTEVEAPVQEQKFYMVDGAQVRVPDVVEAGQEDFDGLRFIAKMTDSYRVARGELENMSVGMFFLPAEKVDTINEAAVFGENATYYWEGCGYEKGDRLEIVHKETYAFEETKGDDFLTIKCSLWNLLPETLGREIGAVAYLRVNVGTKEEPVYEYHFAETGAGAKAVSVAQKALLNEKDEIHTVEGGADRVNAAYVNAYLGADGKEVSYVENVYKQQKDGEYTKVDTVTKSALMTAYNTEAVAGKVDNYTPFDYKNNKENRVVLFDGTTEVNTYYNYSANRFVLWDADENLAEADCFSKGNNTNNRLFYENGKTIYEGVSGYFHASYSAAWGGPWWSGKILPAPTNTLSFILASEYDFTNITFEFKGKNTSGKDTGWLGSDSSTLTYKAVEVFNGDANGYNTDGNSKTLAAGIYEVTVVIPKTVAVLTWFEFLTTTVNSARNDFYIDNLCAVYEKGIAHTNIPYTYSGDSVTFNAPTLGGANVRLDEGEGVAKAVQYRAVGAEDWSDVTAAEGVYTISGLTENTYEVKVINQDDTFAVYTMVKGTLLTDNDGATEEERGVAWTAGYDKAYTADNNSFLHARNFYGNGFMQLHTPYMMYMNDYNIDHSTRFSQNSTAKIGVWAYSSVDGSWFADEPIWVGGCRFTYFPTSGDSTIKAGYHYYEFTCSNFTAAQAFRAIGFRTSADIGLLIDAVAFVN